jgi:hypothetical protein
MSDAITIPLLPVAVITMSMSEITSASRTTCGESELNYRFPLVVTCIRSSGWLLYS